MSLYTLPSVSIWTLLMPTVTSNKHNESRGGSLCNSQIRELKRTSLFKLSIFFFLSVFLYNNLIDLKYHFQQVIVLETLCFAFITVKNGSYSL